MIKIEQIDWSKFKQIEPKQTSSSGTKNFSTHEYKEKTKRSKHGGIKTTRLPKIYRQDIAAHMNHIRSIKDEI